MTIYCILYLAILHNKMLKLKAFAVKFFKLFSAL